MSFSCRVRIRNTKLLCLPRFRCSPSSLPVSYSGIYSTLCIDSNFLSTVNMTHILALKESHQTVGDLYLPLIVHSKARLCCCELYSKNKPVVAFRSRLIFIEELGKGKGNEKGNPPFSFLGSFSALELPTNISFLVGRIYHSN